MSPICCFSVFTVACTSIVIATLCPFNLHAGFDPSTGSFTVNVNGPGCAATNCDSGISPANYSFSTVLPPIAGIPGVMGIMPGIGIIAGIPGIAEGIPGIAEGIAGIGGRGIIAGIAGGIGEGIAGGMGGLGIAEGKLGIAEGREGRGAVDPAEGPALVGAAGGVEGCAGGAGGVGMPGKSGRGAGWAGLGAATGWAGADWAGAEASRAFIRWRLSCWSMASSSSARMESGSVAGCGRFAASSVSR